MKPFFSIVIPTLNEEDSIASLIEQYNSQSYRDFEIIVVDSRSEDNTIEIVKALQKKYPFVHLVQTEKRNLCFQKNEGARLAQGTFLVFQDADNQVLPEYLCQISLHINHSHASFLTTYQLPDTNRTLDRLLADISNIMLDVLAFTPKQMAPGYNLIVAKQLFDQVGGFDESAVFSEDHELSIRLFKHTGTRLHIIRKHLLKWSFRRLHKDGHIPIIIKYSIATLHMLLIGKITNEKFRYMMGGSHYKKDSIVHSKHILDSISILFSELHIVDKKKILLELKEYQGIAEFMQVRAKIMTQLKQVYASVLKFLTE